MLYRSVTGVQSGMKEPHKKAVPPAARIEQTVTVGVPIAAVCCERTRLQLRPFLHWCVCPKESMAPGGRLNIGEALGALP